MALTLPNLDDRRYADLIEEARGLMVAYAPALTNHNPSDPAVTLVELFAYFTEILLFRLNYVTDANRVTFLRLLNGLGWPTPTTRDALDAEVRKTVLMMRRPDRAVTPADFEFLARAADPDGCVARAHCLPERNLDIDDPATRRQSRPGHTSVVIVPSTDDTSTDDTSAELKLAKLKRIVATYLDERRLLTTRVHVVGPRFVPLRVRVTLRLLPDALESVVRDHAVATLTSYLDPITGRDGNGWPFGRNVYVSEIYRLLDTLPGVDFVRRTLGPEDQPLDELVTDDTYADRFVRNDAGELISVALEPDELAQAKITAADISVDLPLTA